MATFKITDRDGAVYRIPAPDDWTDERVRAHFVRNRDRIVREQSEQGPAKSTGFGEAMLIGAGKTANDLVEGVKQGYYALTGNQEAAAQQKAQQAADAEQYAKLAAERPWATGIGETAPLLAIPAAGSVRATMAAAAIPGLVSYGDTKEKVTSAALGAGGAGIGSAIGRGMGAALSRPQVTQSQQLARDAAGRLGVQLRAGELSGSRPLRWAEAALNDLPIAGGMAQKAEQARSSAINRAAARSMGQMADDITPQVFREAHDTISAQYQRILNPLRISLDNTFQSEVKAITGSKVLRQLRDDSVEALLDPFRNLPAGKIKVSGQWFQENKTALDLAIRAAYDGKMAGKARALERFEEALDRAAMRSMNAADREAYTAANRQWASLRLLETGNVVEGGRVHAGRLKESLRSRYKSAFKEGRLTGELPDIATLAEAYKPLPQSGTTPRAIYSGFVGGLGAANLPAAAGMLAGPPAAQAMLQSPFVRRLAAEGIADISPTTRELLGYGGGLLGLAAPNVARP